MLNAEHDTICSGLNYFEYCDAVGVCLVLFSKITILWRPDWHRDGLIVAGKEAC